MSYYIKQGNTFKITPDGALDIRNSLPVGTYVVKFDDQGGFFFLEEMTDFIFKGKKYGSLEKTTERIINTFNDRKKSTGVLLAGEKGSGKTLQAKSLAEELAKQNVPTIIVNTPYTGDGFNKFIQDIDQECVIIFDEFEKVFDPQQQERTLTLLDGTFAGKKLFVLTVNEEHRMNQYMKNRPGRLYYMIKYGALEEAFIREYCEDTCKDKDQIEPIVNATQIFGNFNFDMLQAMVEEINRYGESPQEVIKMLNIKPEFTVGNSYDVTITTNGNVVNSNWNGNFLRDPRINVDYWKDTGVDKDGDKTGVWYDYTFTLENMTKYNPENGSYMFDIEDEGDQVNLVFTKKTYSKASDHYDNLL